MDTNFDPNVPFVDIVHMSNVPFVDFSEDTEHSLFVDIVYGFNALFVDTVFDSKVPFVDIVCGSSNVSLPVDLRLCHARLSADL